MSLPATITQAVAEKIIAFLAPMFLLGTTRNLAAASQVAKATLATYAPNTDRELRCAALSIAFGFGALDALSRSTDPELAVNQMLRLRAAANALNRSAQQNEASLEKLQKHAPDAQAEPPPAEPQADTLPASTATEDLLAFARTTLQSLAQNPPAKAAPPAPAPLSRQQRRAEERRAEKLRQRQQEQARRAARAAARVTESARLSEAAA